MIFILLIWITNDFYSDYLLYTRQLEGGKCIDNKMALGWLNIQPSYRVSSY